MKPLYRILLTVAVLSIIAPSRAQTLSVVQQPPSAALVNAPGTNFFVSYHLSMNGTTFMPDTLVWRIVPVSLLRLSDISAITLLDNVGGTISARPVRKPGVVPEEGLFTVIATNLVIGSGTESKTLWLRIELLPGRPGGAFLLFLEEISGTTGTSTRSVNLYDRVVISVRVPHSLPVLKMSADRTTGQFQFRWPLRTNETYRIEESLDLKSWSTLRTFPGGSGEMLFSLDRAQRTGHKFFRLVTIVPGSISSTGSIPVAESGSGIAPGPDYGSPVDVGAMSPEPGIGPNIPGADAIVPAPLVGTEGIGPNIPVPVPGTELPADLGESVPAPTFGVIP